MNSDASAKPSYDRSALTPTNYADSVFADLAKILGSSFPQNQDEWSQFLVDYTEGWEVDEEFLDEDALPEAKRFSHNLAFAVTAAAFGLRAKQAEEAGAMDMAWTFAADAMYWTGLLRGAHDRKQAINNEVARRARDAADARHRENRALKSEAETWYWANKDNYSSKDRAAEEIATKVVPVAVRTAREWIDKWTKKDRPARRP